MFPKNRKELVSGYSRIRNTKFLFFAIVGVSNTIIGFFLFILLYHLTGFAFFSQALTYFVGVFWSFYWNFKWTFRTTGEFHTRFRAFFLLQLGLLLLTSSLISILADALRLNAALAWIFVMALAPILNYSASAKWVFNKRA